jgi:hypothetical protein
MTAGSLPKSAPIPATEQRAIAVVRSYDDLRIALRAWCSEIGMTRVELDEQAGLADGHSGKLLSPRAVKTFGRVSLGRILAATGLVLVLAMDVDAQPIGDACDDACDETGANHAQHWRSVKGRAWARRMAARRALKLSAEQRSAIARKAAETRWQRKRSIAAAE